MAILENGLLKLAATKASGMAFPLGMVAVAAIWAWRARDWRAAALPRDESNGIGSRREADAGHSSREVSGSASPTPRSHTSHTSSPGSSIAGGTDREALLSQILEDNIRLREALKPH